MLSIVGFRFCIAMPLSTCQPPTAVLSSTPDLPPSPSKHLPNDEQKSRRMIRLVMTAGSGRCVVDNRNPDNQAYIEGQGVALTCFRVIGKIAVFTRSVSSMIDQP